MDKTITILQFFGILTLTLLLLLSVSRYGDYRQGLLQTINSSHFVK